MKSSQISPAVSRSLVVPAAPDRIAQRKFAPVYAKFILWQCTSIMRRVSLKSPTRALGQR